MVLREKFGSLAFQDSVSKRTAQSSGTIIAQTSALRQMMVFELGWLCSYAGPSKLMSTRESH